MGIADKLRNSEITKEDPEAAALLKDLVENITNYITLSSDQFAEHNLLGLLNTFVNQFLNVHAYIGNNKGLNIPSYDPYEIAYTERLIDGETVRYWIALWTNAFIIYSEFEKSHNKDGVLLAIEREYYKTHIKKDPLKNGRE
jgi:hypothetical protein